MIQQQVRGQIPQINAPRVERPEARELTPLELKLQAFPNMSYEQFLSSLEIQSNPELKKNFLSRNRLHTDFYNLSMEKAFGHETWDTPEVFTLQTRKSEQGYNIVMGMDKLISTLSRPFTAAEVLFIRDYYKSIDRSDWFNEEAWAFLFGVEKLDDLKYDDKRTTVLPISIFGLPDGSTTIPGEPVLRVEGPRAFVRFIEHLVHQIFFETRVATKFVDLKERILRGRPDRYMEVGLRSAPSGSQHLDVINVMCAVGFTNTSNTAGPLINNGVVASGTIGHSYMQAFKTEDEAFERAIDTLGGASLLVDMVESYRGIDKAIEIKSQEKYRGQKIFIRLDSGDILDQTIYTLHKFIGNGFLDPTLSKVIVEDLSDVEQIADIMNAVENDPKIKAAFAAVDMDPLDFLIFGAGGMMITQGTSRGDASTGYKLSQYDGIVTAKFSSDEGKMSIPGVTTMYQYVDEHGTIHRIIGQDGEMSEGQFEDLFQPLMVNGQRVYKSTIEETRARVETGEALRKAIREKKQPKTTKSQNTAAMTKEVWSRYVPQES